MGKIKFPANYMTDNEKDHFRRLKKAYDNNPSTENLERLHKYRDAMIQFEKLRKETDPIKEFIKIF